VTGARLRLDPSSLTAAIALAVIAALANGVWILLDHSSPSWDQAHYLSTALQYRDALHLGGPIELIHAINRADPSHGPLFTIALAPALAIFGSSNSSGLLVNLVAAPFLYLAAGQIAYVVFRSGFTRLLTILLVATTPILVGLFHNVLQDFLLVTLTAVALLLLLESERFRRRWVTWGMALTMALGTLTKVTFPLFVIGPFLVVVAQAVTETISVHRSNDREARSNLRRALLNLGGAAIVYLAVTLVWYGPNLSATLDYVRSTTGGTLSEGAGPSNPYTFHAVTSFTLGMINFNLSWIIVLLGIISAALSRTKLRLHFKHPNGREPLWKLAFLLAWALIPYLSVALAHNQDVRLMAPAFPAVAVLAAGACSKVPWPYLRATLAGIAVILLAYQTLNHTTDVTPAFLPDRITGSFGEYEAAIQLNSAPIGYERLPGSDYAGPVLDYVEEVADQEPGGAAQPRTICLLESEPVININTIGFLAAARHDPYGLADVVKPPGTSSGELEDILSGCDFALYSRPPKVPASGPNSRLTLVNEPYAARHMTPRMFRLFEGPSRSFPVENNPPVRGEPQYLSTAGGGRVRVLTRTPQPSR
jgi:4-amino-4-deoxy-L-arabinose transferase-like glycosyltransferase